MLGVTTSPQGPAKRNPPPNINGGDALAQGVFGSVAIVALSDADKIPALLDLLGGAGR
jgi:hypothetical protein